MKPMWQWSTPDSAASSTDMKKSDLERNLGEQPITMIMVERSLKPHDLVVASPEQITHKMVSRACKGRRLTRNVQHKVMRALNRAADTEFMLSDLFNY